MPPMYTTQLQAGLGMIEETFALLQIWEDGTGTPELNKLALEQGIFPAMSARRVRNVVSECFAPRLLIDQGRPALLLKNLSSTFDRVVLRQVYFLFTCRANEILADFIRDVYWPSYAAGKTEIHREDAVNFVVRSNQDGKMVKLWSESTIKRVSSYLVGCCADFGLLEPGLRKTKRQIIPFNIYREVALLLCHQLHFQGLGDNSIVSHPEWGLFGLERFDVIEQLKSLSNDGHFLIQGAGGVVDIGWKYNDMEGLINAIG
ncbi:DUF1819 family protein [bacterium]|nr:DUF1819 family protein [bacterium]